MKPTALSPTWQTLIAITWRDLLLERSYQFQLAMRYVSTFFTVVVFFFIGRLVGDADELGAYGGDYFEFALIGLILMSLATIALSQVSHTFTGESSSRTLELLLASSTPLKSVIAGSLVVPFGLGAVNLGIYLGVGFALGGVNYPLGGSLLAVPILALTILTYVALGIMSAAFLVLTRRGEPFSTLALQMTNVLAGTVFPVEVLPSALQVVSRLFPAFYGLRALRAVLLTGAGIDAVWRDVLILVAFNVVLLPVSMWTLGRALSVAKRLGTLSSG